MTNKFLKVIGIGFILSVSTLANATLIDNGDYTTDTESGLDWLDWTETVNDTQAEALLEFSGDGWRIATSSEAQDLFENHFDLSFGGSTVANSFQTTDWANKRNEFFSLFGITDGTDTYVTIVGAGRFSVQGFQLDINTLDFHYGTSEWESSWTGVALVRALTVSEPVIITIFALGFAGIGFARRRQY
jgi:hypothetical protein